MQSNKRTAGAIGNARAVSAVLFLVLAASAVLPLPDSGGRILGLPSVCPFYELTGLPCPGCGLTRSFVCFAHGRFVEAFHWNLLGPALWIACAVLLLRSAATVAAGRQVLPIGVKATRNAAAAAIVLLVLNDCLRITLLTLEHKRF